MPSTEAPLTTTPPAQVTDRDPRTYLPIPFTVVAVTGLGLWFAGGGNDSDPTSRGLVGAAVLCLSMFFVIGFVTWLAGSSLPLVRTGAVILGLGGLTHLVENLLVLGLGRGGQDESPGVWDVIQFLSPLAFAVLGLGALLISVGLPAPTPLRILGIVAGIAGLVSGLSSIVAALGFLPGPFNVVLLVWLIITGLRARRS